MFRNFGRITAILILSAFGSSFLHAETALPDGVIYRAPVAESLTLVPLNTEGINADGDVNADEWFAASATTGFISNTHRSFSHRQTVVYACFDNDNLYLGFQSDAPADPTAEKMVVAMKPSSELYVFSVSPSGEVKSAHETNLSGEVRAASRIRDGKWSCEITLPFSSLGTSRPAADSHWLGSFGRVYAQPLDDTSWVSKDSNDPMNFADYELGRLQFREDGRYLKVTSVGRLDDSRMRVTGTYYEVPDPSGTEKGELWVDLPLEYKGSLTGYGMTEFYTQGEEMKLSTVSYAGGGMEDETIGEKNPYRSANSVSIGVGLGFYSGWSAVNTGRFLKTERFPVGKPFEPLYLHSWKILPGQKLVAWVETLGLKPEENGSPVLTVETLSPSGTVLERKQVSGVRRGEYEIELDAGQFTIGGNSLNVTLASPDGRQIGHTTTAIEKPDSSVWENNKLGISDKVPAPFEPVHADGNSVYCWGRKYFLKGDSVINALRSADENILGGPIELLARSGGRPVQFSDSGWKMEKVRDFGAVAANTLTSASVDIRLKNTIEYDGMVRVDAVLLPKSGSANLDSLVLRIPIKNRHAGYLSWTRSGSAGDRRNWHYGAFPEDGFRGDFRPFLWVGDEDRGLLWFAESMKNWNIADKSGVLKARRDGPVTEVLVTMIDRPTMIDKPLEITFGLQPSPVRPRPEGWRNYARTVGVFSSSNMDITCYNPSVVEVEAEALSKIAQEGKKPILYAYPQHLNTHIPAYKFHANEWRSSGPIARVKGGHDLDHMCPATGFRDFNVWAEAEGLRRDPQKHPGLLYDLAWVQPCSNVDHGCGYVDSDGKVQPKWNIFAIRDYYRRVYTHFRENHKQTYITGHTSANTIMLPLFGFCDGAWDGEQYAYWIRDYAAEITPDQWRAQFTCRQFGMVPLLLTELRYYTDPVATYKLATMVFLHDVLYMPGFHDAAVMAPFEKAMDAFGIREPDVQFIPYWEAMGKMFRSSDHDVLVSAYKRPGKVLLVAGNLSDRDFQGEIWVDFSALGASPNAVTLVDGSTTTRITVSKGHVATKIKPKHPIFMIME